MTADEGSAGPLLDQIAEHLKARGLAEHGDFYVRGRLPGTVPASEIVGIRELPQRGRYEVWYEDMGSERALVETDDIAEARARFVAEALKLARYRGRRIKDVEEPW